MESQFISFLTSLPHFGPLGIGWIAWLLQLRENKQLRAELHRYTEITLRIMADNRAALDVLNGSRDGNGGVR